MAQDKKFSVIVPLYKDGYTTLDKFLLHLKEQDYTNYEVIFVYNSPDDKAQDAVKQMKKQLKGIDWKEFDAGYIPKLKNGNHCRAFNFGAEMATGDYLLFLDPDVYLYPGILREYKDAFDKNDVEFVYGDYDFVNGAGRIQGRDYNEYELKCANYISGGFPIKKSAFRGWDPNIQSLQDWDMWLSAIDAGAKGFYLGRPCFITEVPTKDGISANQADNWLERYNQVRNKHNFPVSDTAVTSLGTPYHATKMAKILGVDSRVLSNVVFFKEHTYKNIYLLGFYPTVWYEHMRIFYKLGDTKSGLSSPKRIIHWIGTDIFQMQHSISWMAWQNIKGMMNDPEFGFIHLTEAEHTQKELLELGIESEIVPLPAEQQEISPLPEKFTVGVYINPTQDMYHEQFMYSVAEAMPDIDFKFFGDLNMKDKTEDNKEWVGWVNMKEFLPTISALVRITKHDGLPLGPLEAMMAGRNVVSNTNLKHGVYVPDVGGNPDKEDVIKAIRSMETMSLNVEGSAYWKKELDLETYRKRMAKYFI